MAEDPHAETEPSVRQLCVEHEYTRAVETTLRAYGSEIFGFLVATHHSHGDASDAFSDFCMALMNGLPQLEWRSSLRTWLYTLARNASNRLRRDAKRGIRGRAQPFDDRLHDLADAVRTETLAFLKTQTRTRLEQLRDSLEPEDRELLVLRIDRGLAWNDLAHALHDGDSALDDADLTRAAQRLRKRFQAVKDRLRELARREGLAT